MTTTTIETHAGHSEAVFATNVAVWLGIDLALIETRVFHLVAGQIPIALLAAVSVPVAVYAAA